MTTHPIPCASKTGYGYTCRHNVNSKPLKIQTLLSLRTSTALNVQKDHMTKIFRPPELLHILN